MKKDFLKDISDFIFLHHELSPADVIFLPGSSFPEQPECAARLYQKGYGKLIVPSGFASIHEGAWTGAKSGKDRYPEAVDSEAAFFSMILRKNGVPSDVILEEKEARFTKENAIFSKNLLEKKSVSIKSGILVCRAFHARRAFMYYRMAFPDVDFMVCPVYTVGVTKDNWFLSEYGLELVLGEVSKCGSQLLNDVKSVLFS